MVQKIIYLGIAGAFGTVFRFTLSSAVQRFSGLDFPIGTWVVNILGCFIAGVLWTIFENKVHLPEEIRFVVLIGFIGAFTTFATFIMESQLLLQESKMLLLFVNLISQNIVGLIMLYLGMMVGKMQFLQ